MVRRQLDVLLQEGPTEAELARVKKGTRATLLSVLQSNSSMASALASYHIAHGSYRALGQELQALQDLRTEDVLGVARRVLAPSNCFTGYVLKA